MVLWRRCWSWVVGGDAGCCTCIPRLLTASRPPTAVMWTCPGGVGWGLFCLFLPFVLGGGGGLGVWVAFYTLQYGVSGARSAAAPERGPLASHTTAAALRLGEK